MDGLSAYDAVLLVSFGGPERPEDVVDFLEVVTKGSGIPRSRLATVGEHYFLFGGKSPINDQCRALIAALDEELVRRGHRLPIYWGNRNWHPFIDEAVAKLVADGHKKVLMLTTSAYPSYSGCRSYREAVLEALQEAGSDIQVDRIGNYALDDGYVDANARALATALRQQPGSRVVFVTHSIPTDMDEASGVDGHAYVTRHEQVAERVFAAAGGTGEYDLVYCSRSGRPGQPWLEPDVNDHLAALHEQGVGQVVLAPIGFVSDHMEVIYDLDTQALATCRELGIQMVRAATAGVDAGFIASLVDRMERRAEQVTSGQACAPDGCGGVGCCLNPTDPATPALD